MAERLLAVAEESPVSTVETKKEKKLGCDGDGGGSSNGGGGQGVLLNNYYDNSKRILWAFILGVLVFVLLYYFGNKQCANWVEAFFWAFLVFLLILVVW